MLPDRAADVPPLARDTFETRPSNYRYACEVNMFRLKHFFPLSIHLPNLGQVPMIRTLLLLAIAVALAANYGDSPRAASVGPGEGNVPQGTQSDSSFTNSFLT